MRKLQVLVWGLVVISMMLSTTAVSAQEMAGKIFLPIISKAIQQFKVNCGEVFPEGWEKAFEQDSACAVKLNVGYTYNVQGDQFWYADGDGTDLNGPFSQSFSGPVTFWRLQPSAQPLTVTEVVPTSTMTPTATPTTVPTSTMTPTATPTTVPTNTMTPTATPTTVPTNTMTPTATPVVRTCSQEVPAKEGWEKAFEQDSACAVKLNVGYTYNVQGDQFWYADGDGTDLNGPFSQSFSGPVTFWRLQPSAQPLTVTEVVP